MMFFITNLSSTPITIEDLGYRLDGMGVGLLTSFYSQDELSNSADLSNLIYDSTSITISNGYVNLTVDEALDYLTPENVYDVRKNHYTKTQLETSGDATIHWDNVSNAPSFSAFTEHLDGTGTKHLDTEVAITSNLTTIGNVITDSIGSVLVNVDSKLSDIYSDITSVADDLAQEIIDRGSADSTIWTAINALNAAGDILIDAGILYSKDSTRVKWLAPRNLVTFARDGVSNNTYLSIGTVVSNASSQLLDANYTLVGVTIMVSTLSEDGTIHIRTNGSDIDEVSFPLLDATTYSDSTLNLDFSLGDTIQVFSTSTSGSFATYPKDPVVTLYFARNYGPIV